MAKTTHKVKIISRFFWKVFLGEMLFQIRKNDRNYKEGDQIILQEFDGEKLTGNQLSVDVGFVTDFKQQQDHIVFSIKNVKMVKKGDTKCDTKN